jgi:CubicO group peptidase (beta-lactamase class C family)
MRRPSPRRTSLLAAVWLLIASASAPAAVTLDPATQAASGLPRLYSLLVSQRGELVVERYLHGGRPATLANLKSASKSVISALVGIAIERGLLPGVQAPIAPFFPTLLDPQKRQITIEDLLTMRSGLASTSNRNYGAWVQSPNWVRYILSRPLLGPPGEQMNYSTGNTHLLSAILTQVSGGDTWKFAQDALARPLGITLAKWPQDPQGIYFGGNEMLLTPRQMVAFGELYLHHGLANGRQVVPAAWVDASCVPRTRSPRNDRPYGYGWWIEDLAGHRACYAWGFGGQYIFVVPDLEMVVVTTSSASAGEDRRGHRSAIFDLVERLIIEPLASHASSGN